MNPSTHATRFPSSTIQKPRKRTTTASQPRVVVCKLLFVRKKKRGRAEWGGQEPHCALVFEVGKNKKKKRGTKDNSDNQKNPGRETNIIKKMRLRYFATCSRSDASSSALRFSSVSWQFTSTTMSSASSFLFDLSAKRRHSHPGHDGAPPSSTYDPLKERIKNLTQEDLFTPDVLEKERLRREMPRFMPGEKGYNKYVDKWVDPNNPPWKVRSTKLHIPYYVQKSDALFLIISPYKKN